jgi:hypothetical protein
MCSWCCSCSLHSRLQEAALPQRRFPAQMWRSLYFHQRNLTQYRRTWDFRCLPEMHFFDWSNCRSRMWSWLALLFRHYTDNCWVLKWWWPSKTQAVFAGISGGLSLHALTHSHLHTKKKILNFKIECPSFYWWNIIRSPLASVSHISEALI